MYFYNMKTLGRPSTQPRSSLGMRIAEARKRLGLSQIELAEAIGVTQQTITVWERKAESIRTDSLLKLCAALKVSADQLLGLAGPDDSGPSGRANRILTDVSRLPRRQQDKVLDVVEGFVQSHLPVDG